jgi:acetolactate synthase-1/2/3 large subunit
MSAQTVNQAVEVGRAANVAPLTVAEHYLAHLKRRGIDYLYVNAGTDFPSIVEAYARVPASGLDLPQPVIVAHENAAVCMALGYTMITGRPQAVMVHVSVGTANAICGLMNAARDNVPLLFTAGRTPLFEEGRFGARTSYIHWAQEMFDQASMLREFVKWDYELRDGLNVAQVVDRALAVAMARPRGPVYLTLPREVLAQRPEQVVPAAPGGNTPPAEAYPDPTAVERAAQILAAADNPLIVALASGQDPATVPLLADLAERFAIPVVENRARFVCLPASHPMHLGYELAPLKNEVDAILALEADVPWITLLDQPNRDAPVIHAGPDPLFSRYPMRSFRADVSIASSSRAFLSALAAALKKACAGQSERIESRRQRVAERRAVLRANVAAELRADELAGGPITKLWLNRCLEAAKPRAAIVVNEYWAERRYLTFDEPGTFFQYPPVGALGWGLPAALGAQQAARDRVVIATVGDGAYMFANPAACHQVAAAQRLPLLTIVCNNARWEAVAGATQRMYPQGVSVQSEEFPLSSLDPSPRFDLYVEASGGYGELVSERAELPGALERALKVVREEKRQALLNVICV